MPPRRLAKANVRRREQLLYWIHHPDQPDVVSTRVSYIGSQAEPTLTKRSNNGKTTSPDTIKSNVQLEGAQMRSQVSQSFTSKQSFSTVVKSDIHETDAGTRLRTIYTESRIGDKMINRVPSVPNSSNTAHSFDCPYCHLVLDSKTMEERKNWK